MGRSLSQRTQRTRRTDEDICRNNPDKSGFFRRGRLAQGREKFSFLCVSAGEKQKIVSRRGAGIKDKLSSLMVLVFTTFCINCNFN